MAVSGHHRALFAVLTEPPDTRILEPGRYRVIRARPFFIATLKKAEAKGRGQITQTFTLVGLTARPLRARQATLQPSRDLLCRLHEGGAAIARQPTFYAMLFRL